MTTTAKQIIEGAARLIGVIRKGESLSADEAADGLVALNDLLASWANNRLLIYAKTWEYFTIATGASYYTIGTGQSFNTKTPNVINAAFIRSSNIDNPLTLLSDEDFYAISSKNFTSLLPQYINFDHGFPIGKIRLYPIPSGGIELHLLSEKSLTSFATLDSVVDLPDGWNRTLRYNLAIDIAPEYDAVIPPSVATVAAQTKATIAGINSRNMDLSYSGEKGLIGNIYTGYW